VPAPRELLCNILAERTVDDLAAAREAFSDLPDYVPGKAQAFKWERSNGESHDLTVVALRKSGYGKSTTLNGLLRENVFETSDISGCTRTLQSIEYRFSTAQGQYYCSFADLPGLGETRSLDEEYYPLYRDTLRMAHVVLYFLRADQRDYSIDQRAFDELVRGSLASDKVILVLNAIDRIEPLNRALPFSPSMEQQRSLKEKIEVVQRIFSVPKTAIVSISGAEVCNLDGLARMIVQRLAPLLFAA